MLHLSIWSLWLAAGGGASSSPRCSLVALGRLGSSASDEVGPRRQALRPAAAGRPDHRARRRSRLSGAACCRPDGTSAMALALQGQQGAVVIVSARRDRARRRGGRRADPAASAILGREVACDNFQDAEAFLRGGGERGRQLGDPDRRHLPHQPGAVRRRDAARTRRRFGMSPDDLRVYQMPPDQVGIVTMLDGQPIAAGDLAGPIVPGHDNFQRGQAFIDAGGCRGLQEEVLLSGSWNLNPWFVQVEQVPMTEIPIGYVGVVVSYVGARARRRLAATRSRTATSSSAAARACGSSRCCPASTRSTRAS